MINRRDFSYEIKTVYNREVLLLVDRSYGNQMMKSGHVEWAIAEIKVMNPNIDFSNKMVLIQSTDGRWEGYDRKKQAFAMLDCPSPGAAVSAFTVKLLQT
jgi:hypothetical protein